MRKSSSESSNCVSSSSYAFSAIRHFSVYLIYSRFLKRDMQQFAAQYVINDLSDWVHCGFKFDIYSHTALVRPQRLVSKKDGKVSEYLQILLCVAKRHFQVE